MYTYFSNEPDADCLFIKLVKEFERCILSYFAFHWTHVPYMMSQVARVLTTLVEEMKAIGLISSDDSQCTDVMVPMAHKDRSPVLLFMGGGMDTVLKDILKEDVLMDGTLSWIPFVVQTITMARNVHYRMGAGYKVEEDGRVTETTGNKLMKKNRKLMGLEREELIE
ncbi:hypothetical protein RND71_030736 [Anisodus tanguticus]|uniref:Uncharacterized protein n=1 Tax=Anisodus tanguticus TaxID=243964 RepID=A0AAE1RI48_9SOLA|nr:hypothetical protein RND71_030736 [Anisodus tanguticus]